MFKRRASIFFLAFVCGYSANVLAEDLPDPTKPLAYSGAVGTAEPLKLQAVFLGGGRKEAIVSGVLVREGGVIYERRVLAIHKNRIILRGASGAESLYLRANIFSQ